MVLFFLRGFEEEWEERENAENLSVEFVFPTRISEFNKYKQLSAFYVF